MLPIDSRSPFRNQRWVECEGSDLQFGDCVEISGGTRPEMGSALTPGGGRTVFQVVTPTNDNVKNTIIIGHMEGSRGYCTNDFPTYAKCDQNVSVGDEVGPMSGSRTLSPNAKGYLVMGDVAGGMARVRRNDREPHYKGKVAKLPHHVPLHDYSVHLCDLMVFDLATETWVNVKDEDGENKEIGVWDRNRDCCVFLGEMHDVKYTGKKDDGQTNLEIWHWVGEAGLTREVEVSSDVQAGGTGQGFFVFHDTAGSCAGETIIEPCTFCNKGGSLKSGDRIIVHWLENVWVRNSGGGGGATTIVFTMTTDRTRQQIGTGDIGFANAIINDKVGNDGDAIGETVSIVFADKRWLEAVTGCQGIADYVYDPAKAALLQQEDPFFWIVKECQGLTQGFWFITEEDRDASGATQDVRVSVIKNVGHANDDFPREYWNNTPAQQSPGGCGTMSLVWVDNRPEGGTEWGWRVTATTGTCGTLDCVPPNDEILRTSLDPRRYVGETMTLDCIPSQPNDDQQNDQQSESQITVRYLEGTFPRMITGAIGYAQLDNDIVNTENNSTMRYYVVQSDQMAKRCKAALIDKMCGDDALIAQDSHTILDFYPFGQLPTNVGTVIPNPQGHGGMAGDVIKFEWNETAERWEVYDVTKHKKKLSTNLGVTEENGCYSIAHVEQEAYIEICEEGEGKALLSYRTQTVTDVTTLRVDKDQQGGSGSSCTSPKLIIDVTQYQGLVLCQNPVPETIEMPLPAKAVTMTVVDDGACVYEVRQQLLVLGVCGDEFEVDIFCTTDEQCESGSGQ